MLLALQHGNALAKFIHACAQRNQRPGLIFKETGDEIAQVHVSKASAHSAVIFQNPIQLSFLLEMWALQRAPMS